MKITPIKNIPDWLWLFLFLAVVFLVWSPYIGNGFLESWDDPVQVLHPNVSELNWTNLKYIFSSLFLGMYQPLSSTFYALVNTFFHQSATVVHFASILLHLLNTVFVYLFLRHLPVATIWRWLITGLFALHPIQQEAIGWASATSTLLFAAFFILSLLFYTKYIRNTTSRRRLYILSLLSFLFACLCKPNAITLPVILFLLDYLFQRDLSWHTVKEKLPFLLLSIVFGLVVLLERGGYVSAETLGIDYWAILISPYGFFAVLKGYFWPPQLFGIYEYPLELPLVESVVSCLLIVLLAYLVLRKRKSNRLFVFGLGFYFVNLLLVSNVFGYGVTFFDLRRLYLPALGLLLSGASLVPNLPSRVVLFCAVPLLILLGYISYGDSIHWKDAHHFYKWNIQGPPPHGISLSNLGLDYAKDPAMVDSLFEITDQLRSQYTKGESYKNLLMLEPVGYLYRGQFQPAVDIVQELLKKYPDDREAMLFSARTLYSLTLHDMAVEPAKKVAALYTLESPERYEMLNMLYKIFKQKEDHESVVWVLDQVIATILSGALDEREKASLHRFYHSKSQRLEQLNRHSEAINALNQALEAAELYGAPLDTIEEYREKLFSFTIHP